ncbi:MAG: SGNH/GDSL hydrolase family protein [Leucothrix sp.]
MRIKSIIANLTLLSVSALAVLGVSEVASRYMVPVSSGPSLLDMNGNALSQSYIKPNTQFRIITPDFDAPTSITADGYRGPEAKDNNPTTLFVGDSFTYGQGVKDNEAFPHLFCEAKNLSCANLAVPGASTLYEVDRLEAFLKKKGWAPDNVYLFFFTGNDFGDNNWAAEQRRLGKSYEPVELHPEIEKANKASLPFHKRLLEQGFKYSNLLRVAYFKVLPSLRQQGDPEAHKAQMEQSLLIAKEGFERLHKLSQAYAFKYKIFVLYSEPEIRQNRHKLLRDELQRVAPSKIISLGEIFETNTAAQYFPADGHFTVSGNRLLAEHLGKIIPE